MNPTPEMINNTLTQLKSNLLDSIETLKKLDKKYPTTDSTDNASEYERQVIWNAVKAHEKLVSQHKEIETLLFDPNFRKQHIELEKYHSALFEISRLIDNNVQLFGKVQWDTVKDHSSNQLTTSDKFKPCQYRYDVEELKALSDELNALDKNENNLKMRSQKLENINTRAKEIEAQYPDFKSGKQQITGIVSNFQAAKQEKADADTAVNDSRKAMENSGGIGEFITSLVNFLINKIKLSTTEREFAASQEKVTALEEKRPKVAVIDHLAFFKSSYESKAKAYASVSNVSTSTRTAINHSQKPA